MIRSLVGRAAAMSILSVLLVASWSSAEPLQRHGATAPPAQSTLWSRLTSLWSDIGCVIDPGGRCLDAAASQGDVGCGIDPNGHCRGAAPIQGDVGCGIDPNGGCTH